MQMHALSLWQPWASAMGRGKTIETRSWPAPADLIGRRVAFHAAKRPMNAEARAVAEMLVDSGIYSVLARPYGAIVSHGLLVSCHQVPGRPWVPSWIGGPGFVLPPPSSLGAN